MVASPKQTGSYTAFLVEQLKCVIFFLHVKAFYLTFTLQWMQSESSLGLASIPRIFGMQTGAVRAQTTNLLISRCPALPFDLQLPQTPGALSVTLN